MTGLLIVNADDFGGHQLATDRIAQCFEAQRITSATAMVYMEDSERAAELARSHKLPIGLHLNLTQEFEDAQAPFSIRERQARAVRYFANKRRRRITYNPMLRSLVKACIADQLSCFRELFGVEPTHIDGHNHAHLSPTVLFALPKNIPVRTGESNLARTIAPHTLFTSARHATLARRQITTDRLVALDRLNSLEDRPASEGALADLLRAADTSTVEVMAHPHRDRDYRLLMSERWHRMLEQCKHGSYVELASASV